MDINVRRTGVNSIFVKVGCQEGTISNLDSVALRLALAAAEKIPIRSKCWVLHKNGIPYEGKNRKSEYYETETLVVVEEARVSDRPSLGRDSSLCCTSGKVAGDLWEWIYTTPPIR